MEGRVDDQQAWNREATQTMASSPAQALRLAAMMLNTTQLTILFGMA
jgi:hypothetical protein